MHYNSINNDLNKNCSKKFIINQKKIKEIRKEMSDTVESVIQQNMNVQIIIDKTESLSEISIKFKKDNCCYNKVKIICKIITFLIVLTCVIVGTIYALNALLDH